MTEVELALKLAAEEAHCLGSPMAKLEERHLAMARVALQLVPGGAAAALPTKVMLQKPGDPEFVPVENPLVQRAVLLDGLLRSGATVFMRRVHGHLLALIMPGENEVLNQHNEAVWSSVEALLSGILEQNARSPMQMGRPEVGRG